jgi:hypothetical protein
MSNPKHGGIPLRPTPGVVFYPPDGWSISPKKTALE